MLKIKDYLITKDEILYITKKHYQGENLQIEVGFINGKCISIYFQDEEIRNKEFEKLIEKVESDEQMNTETNFMSFENLTKLIEEHNKETYPYKKYEFDSTSYTLLLISINNLIKENQELKKQVEEYKEQVNKGLYNTCLPYTTGYNKAIKDKEIQQKEFIEWLEEELKRINPSELTVSELVNSELEQVEFTQYLTYKSILQKYKEIIGDDK